MKNNAKKIISSVLAISIVSSNMTTMKNLVMAETLDASLAKTRLERGADLGTSDAETEMKKGGEAFDLFELKNETLKWSLANNSQFDFKYGISLLLAGLDKSKLEDMVEAYNRQNSYNTRLLNTIRSMVFGNSLKFLEDIRDYDLGDGIEGNIKSQENYIYTVLALKMLGEEYDQDLVNNKLVEAIMNGTIKIEYLADAVAAIGPGEHTGDLLDLVWKKLEAKDLRFVDLINLLESLVILGEDIESDRFKATFSLIENYKRDAGYAPTSKASWKKDGEEVKLLKLLVTMEDKEDIYRQVSRGLDLDAPVFNNLEIKIKEPIKEFKEFDDLDLLIETYKNGEKVNLAYDLISDNDDVVKVDGSNGLRIMGPGTVTITARLRNNEEIADRLKLKVARVEVKAGKGKLQDFIDAIYVYYNREHYKDTSGRLKALELASFKKAGFPTSRWKIEEDYRPNYDKDLAYIGNKARQVEVMLASGRDPRNYNNRDLIEEIVDILNTGRSKDREFKLASYPYLLGLVAVNNYNEKYPNSRVDYNEDLVLPRIEKAQEKNGGLIERDVKNGIAPRNTALAVEALSKMESQKARQIKDKALDYLNRIQKENGGIYERSYITSYNAEIVRSLLVAGENLTGSKWTKNGVNPIESLFYLIREDNSFKDFVGDDMASLNNPKERDLDAKLATQAVLECLVEVAKAYPDYVVKTREISGLKDVKEAELSLETAIISLDKNGKPSKIFGPKKITINNKLNSGGFTALGALQATTGDIEMNYGFVESIGGLSNNNGASWMYSVNGEFPYIAAGNKKVEEGDKLIWVYLPKEAFYTSPSSPWLNSVKDEFNLAWEDLEEPNIGGSLDEVKYLKSAIKVLDGFVIKNLDSDKDKNVLDILKDKLKSLNYEGLDVDLLSVENNDEQIYVKENGDINYLSVHPSEQRNPIYPKISTCKFRLSMGQAKEDIAIRISNDKWDKDKFRKVIEDEILGGLEKEILANNTSFSDYKSDAKVRSKIGSKGYDYLEVKLESDNTKILDIVKTEGQALNKRRLDYMVKVKPSKRAEKVNLSLSLHTVQGSEEVYRKNFELIVTPLNGGLEDFKDKMSKALEDNYGEDKLKDFLTGENLDFDNVVNDIKLPSPRETGIEGYDNFKFFLSSSNEDVIKPFKTKNAGKLVVYRPLVGEKPVKVDLTVNMEDKNTGLVASKKLRELTVQPLTDEEIERELKLMDLVKENFFEIIRGENKEKDKISQDLKWFREARLSKDGLVWTTSRDKDLNFGITPDALDNWYDTEEWRIFRSSNPAVISHENLLVTRPNKDTKVRIDSLLTSVVYGKYAEKYPDDKRFKQLYRQPVSLDLLVLAKDETRPVRKNLEVKNLGDKNLIRGEEFKSLIRVKNEMPIRQPLLLILVLYNKKDHSLENYSIAEQVVGPNGEVEIGSSILVPKDGDFYSKVFLWDGFNDQEILMDKAIKINK